MSNTEDPRLGLEQPSCLPLPLPTASVSLVLGIIPLGAQKVGEANELHGQVARMQQVLVLYSY